MNWRKTLNIVWRSALGTILLVAVIAMPASPNPSGKGQIEVLREIINILRENPSPNLTGYLAPTTALDTGRAYLGITFGPNGQVMSVASMSPAWFAGFEPGERVIAFYQSNAWHSLSDLSLLRPNDQVQFLVEHRDPNLGLLQMIRTTLLGPNEDMAILEMLHTVLTYQDRYQTLSESLRSFLLAKPSLGFDYTARPDLGYWEVQSVHVRYLPLQRGDRIVGIYALPSGAKLDLGINPNFWDSVHWPAGLLCQLTVLRPTPKAYTTITVRMILAPNARDMKLE